MTRSNPTGTVETRRRSLRSPILALAILVGVGVWIWLQGSEGRAIRSLPAGERVALYERTLENVRTVCASPDLALEEYCREQARLLLEFPECDEACRKLAHGELGRRAP